MSLPDTDVEFRRDLSPDLGTTMRPSDLDFVTYNRDHEIRDILNDPILERTVILLDKYQAIIDGNMSLVRHRNRDPWALVGNTFEENLRKEFHNRGPSLVAGESGENSPIPSLNWVNVIRETEDKDMILQDDGSYHYSFRGQLIRLSEHERGYIIHVRKLLEPWPHPEDMKKENETIQAVIRELRDYENALMAVIKQKKDLVTRLNERRSMIHRYLTTLSRPSPVSRTRNSPSKPRQTSPVNSIIHDTRDDIDYAISSDDSSNTDQSADEDMEMQDVHHDRPEERRTDGLPQFPPTTQQIEETRETEIILLDEPGAASSTQGMGWSIEELLESAAAIYGSDATASSTNKQNTPRRKRHPRKQKTEEEIRNGYKFVKERKDSKVPWDHIILEYNATFGVDRTKEGLKSMFERWKLENGAKIRSSASRRGGPISRASRRSRSWRKSTNIAGQHQSTSAGNLTGGAPEIGEEVGSTTPGPSVTSTA